MKRLLAILLSIVLLMAFLPYHSSALGDAEPTSFAQRYPMASEIWQQIEALETETLKSETLSRPIEQTIYDLVAASETTREGSIDWHGNAFFWQTEDGAACGYLPGFRDRMRKSVTGSDTQLPELKMEYETPELSDDTEQNIAVIQPYFGLDASFTAQYADEGALLADACSSTCTVYRMDDANVDAVAAALQTCKVVIFDSHGLTDWENGTDSVTETNTSYVCLQSGDGLTDVDMTPATGVHGSFYHAFYGGTYRDNAYFCVDGSTIAAHMTQNAPNSLIWTAFGFGMATDGFASPLRQKGADVVYGYSQKISVRGDYLFESAFFSALRRGATVKNAILYMKRMYGEWDPTVRANSAEAAQARHAAFPIVASTVDAYPGQGNADAPQSAETVWRLFNAKFLYGDVNCDKKLNAADASILLRYVVKLSKISRDGLLAADVDLDGTVSAADALLIVMRIISNIRSFPADN